jgi:predicted nucleic acid-binding protein
MIVVVSDTSPINYLVLIGHIEVLPAIFGKVLIPVAVHEELQQEGAPPAIRSWVSSLPGWVEIRKPTFVDESMELGKGEMEAIALAKETEADFLLIDERKGSQAARDRHLKTAGTLAVLDRSDALGLLDFEQAVSKLQKTNFRAPQALIGTMTERVRTRKKEA